MADLTEKLKTDFSINTINSYALRNGDIISYNSATQKLTIGAPNCFVDEYSNCWKNDECKSASNKQYNLSKEMHAKCEEIQGIYNALIKIITKDKKYDFPFTADDADIYSDKNKKTVQQMQEEKIDLSRENIQTQITAIETILNKSKNPRYDLLWNTYGKAQQNLCLFYLTLGDFNKCAEISGVLAKLYEKAHSFETDANAYFYNALAAFCHEKIGDLNAAENFLAQPLRHRPIAALTGYRMHLADIAEQLGELPRAVNHLEKLKNILKEEIDHNSAKESKQVLRYEIDINQDRDCLVSIDLAELRTQIETVDLRLSNLHQQIEDGVSDQEMANSAFGQASHTAKTLKNSFFKSAHLAHAQDKSKDMSSSLRPQGK